MSQHWVTTKQKTIAVEPGLYLLRYESAPDSHRPPVARVVCDPSCNEIILDHRHNTPLLSAPGMSLVVRAHRRGKLLIELMAAPGGRSTEATLKVEPLLAQAPEAVVAAPVVAGGQSGVYRASPAVSQQPPAADRGVMPGLRQTSLSLLGHIARRGDVVVGAGEWLGGPTTPNRIEGFEIRWPNPPAGVELQYAALCEGERPEDARLMETGAYAGSRQRAVAVVEAMLEIFGPEAGRYSLDVAFLFQGQSVSRATGNRVDLSGPTGREPLVGLAINIRAMENPMALADPSTIVAEGAPGVASDIIPVKSSRVRIFR